MNASDLFGAARDLGVRFALVGLAPAATLELFVIGLLWSGAPSHAPSIDQIAAHAETLDAWEGLLLLFVLVVAAVISLPLQLALVRLLEGYWQNWPFGRRIAQIFCRLQQRRLDKLEALQTVVGHRPTDEDRSVMQAARFARDQRFPKGRPLPTQLGNALRAAEDRAGGRYGLDTVLVWPRLYPLLTDAVRAFVDDARDQLDVAARFVVVWVIAAAVSLGLLATHGWWLLVPVACLALAWLAYRAALSAAIAFGTGLDTAFDLCRFELLRAFCIPVPNDSEAERKINEDLSKCLLEGKPWTWPYAVPAPKGSDGTQTTAAVPEEVQTQA